MVTQRKTHAFALRRVRHEFTGNLFVAGATKTVSEFLSQGMRTQLLDDPRDAPRGFGCEVDLFSLDRRPVTLHEFLHCLTPYLGNVLIRI